MTVIGLRGGPGSADAAVVEQFVAQTGVTFPVGFDGGSYNQFRTTGGGGLSPFPLDVVIGRDGRVAYVSREYEPAQMQSVITTLLSAGGSP